MMNTTTITHTHTSINIDIKQLENEFNHLLPVEYRNLDKLFWSDTQSISKACEWLQNCTNIIDLGSGIGKFCMIGTQILSSNFFGIESKIGLYEIANNLLSNYLQAKVQFKNEDLFNIDLQPYDGIYIYNPFVELISTGQRIDDSIPLDEEKYNSLHENLEEKLTTCSKDTLIVNNSPINDYFNHHFAFIDNLEDSNLTLWKKID